MKTVLWILRWARNVLVVLIAMVALLRGCVAHAQTNIGEVTIESSQWAELVDLLYYYNDDNSLANMFFNTFWDGTVGGWPGTGMDYWRRTRAAQESISNELGLIHMDLADWFDAAQTTLDESLFVQEETRIGVESIDDTLLRYLPAISNYTARTADATEDSASSLANLESWGTPTTGPGIRVQLAGIRDVNALINVSGVAVPSVGVLGYGGAVPYPEVMSTGSAYSSYGDITNKSPDTNLVAKLQGSNVTWGAWTGTTNMGLGRSPTLTLIDKEWSELSPMFSNVHTRVTFTVDLLKIQSDPDVWNGVRSFWTVAFIVMMSVFCINLYRSMG